MAKWGEETFTGLNRPNAATHFVVINRLLTKPNGILQNILAVAPRRTLGGSPQVAAQRVDPRAPEMLQL